MIETFIKIRKRAIKYLTLYSPILTIILVYILQLDLISIIARVSPSLNQELISKPTLNFTLNSSVFVLLVNLLIDFFKHPSLIEVNLVNNSRKKDSYFDIRSSETHRPSTVHMNVKVEYNNWFVLRLIHLLGGISLNCIYPHWIDCRIDNKRDLKKETLIKDIKEEFTIDLGKAIQKKREGLDLYLKLGLISNSFEVNEGEVNCHIEATSENKFKKAILYACITLFFDVKISGYKVEARKDIR